MVVDSDHHLKTSPNIDKSTFKCTHCNKTGPTSLDIPQFQSNDSWYDQENNEESREANVAEKASALVAATDHGGFTLRLSSQKIVSKPMDIKQDRRLVVVLTGKTLLLETYSQMISNKLQQALMADGSEEEKKKSEIWLCIDVWDMLPLVI
ncbi:hypothetical protein CK203_029440 [Vitis vinifera]|uniref:Uncharacterized protein n=1 Tax=Vitis vinifera TaxID=29760 RepID=A0A438HWV3_VITVI|nr:hypothetical protein CK203_029440 [Vitis vinifera]